MVNAGNGKLFRPKNKWVLKPWKGVVETSNAVGKQTKAVLEMLHVVLFKLQDIL